MQEKTMLKEWQLISLVQLTAVKLNQDASEMLLTYLMMLKDKKPSL
jgi:hypothetical protein